MSFLELAAFVITFAGLAGIISQRGAARRAGRPVKRWLIALSIALMIIGIALAIIGVTTGVVSLT